MVDDYDDPSPGYGGLGYEGGPRVRGIPVVWVTHDHAQVWITFEDKKDAETYANDLGLTVSESVWLPRQTGDKGT